MERADKLGSADIKLWLMSGNKKYEGNPVYLHSTILDQSEFFKVKMPEHRPFDETKEIKVVTSHGFREFLKCIQFMYGEPVHFSTVEESLAILPIASELLPDEFINKCMQYLEAVCWRPEQETQIRDVLSSLGVKPLPDLAARLDKEDDYDQTVFVEGMINQMISLVLGRHQVTRNRAMAEKYLKGIFEGSSSKQALESTTVCARALLREFKSCIGSGDLVGMRSLLQIIEYCEREVPKASFIAILDNAEFTEYVKKLAWGTSQPHSEDAFYIVIRFMKAMGDGKMIISRASRTSFLLTWIPILTKLCFGQIPKFTEFEKAVLKIIESLPLANKKQICLLWAEKYNEYNIDIATPFTLFNDLQGAHYSVS